jgi:hypothetical protein
MITHSKPTRGRFTVPSRGGKGSQSANPLLSLCRPAAQNITGRAGPNAAVFDLYDTRAVKAAHRIKMR